MEVMNFGGYGFGGCDTHPFSERTSHLQPDLHPVLIFFFDQGRSVGGGGATRSAGKGAEGHNDSERDGQGAGVGGGGVPEAANFVDSEVV